jgi:hypothetical protein
MVGFGSLTSAHQNFLNVSCVPFAASYTSRFSVSYGDKQTLGFNWPEAEKCPTETLVALKGKAIFGQFLSLIQDEIRCGNRTFAAFHFMGLKKTQSI